MSMNKRAIIKTGILASLILSSGLINSANYTQVNRYATIENKATRSQIDPLSAIQQTRFGKNIKTTGEAINHWLSFTGFELAEDSARIDSLKSILEKPLPQVDRVFGPMTVREGLEVLAGFGIFTLAVDPLNRKVNFKLTPKYALIAKQQGRKA